MLATSGTLSKAPGSIGQEDTRAMNTIQIIFLVLWIAITEYRLSVLWSHKYPRGILGKPSDKDNSK